MFFNLDLPSEGWFMLRNHTVTNSLLGGACTPHKQCGPWSLINHLRRRLSEGNWKALTLMEAYTWNKKPCLFLHTNLLMKLIELTNQRGRTPPDSGEINTSSKTRLGS